MKTVSQLLGDKGATIWSVAPGDTVYSAIELMATKSVGALLVLEGERLAGILSERDYARNVILKGRNSRETKVSEIMTSKVICVPPSRNIDECMALMTEKRIRHLPVLEEQADGRRSVTGVISIGDVVRAMIEEKQFIIEQLENYIQGG
jgi:CBS domain-containing protein